MAVELMLLPNHDLERELSFAEGFGPEIHENAQDWIDAIRAEMQRRGLDTGLAVR